VKRREKEKRMTWGDQASVSKAHNFIFKRNFLYLDLYIEGNERCKSEIRKRKEDKSRIFARKLRGQKAKRLSHQT